MDLRFGWRWVAAPAAALLCLGLNACGGAQDLPPTAAQAEPAVSSRPAVPGPPMPSPAGQQQAANLLAVVRAQAINDLIVVRKPGTVSVVARSDGRAMWSVPERAGDPITKARLAQGSIVVVRRSQTAEVYDLKTGALRFSKENAGAVGVTWTMLYADSAVCQPDCLLRAYDLATGAERWAGPKALPGKVMTEVGESPERGESPAAELAGPLRASEASVVAVRTAEGIRVLDATSGQELALRPLPAAGVALGSDRVLVEWSAVKDCKVTVIGRDIRGGEITWQSDSEARVLGQQLICGGEPWRPTIADGLIIMFDRRAPARAIEIDTAKAVWNASTFRSQAVAVTRQAIITYGPEITATQPDRNNPAWINRLWAVPTSDGSKVTGIILDFDRLAYVTEYEGSARGIGWVRDLVSGRRLWYADGLRPLGIDGDRVIVETPSGEIRLERMVSTG